jgi:hypothetical protein
LERALECFGIVLRRMTFDASRSNNPKKVPRLCPGGTREV